MDLAREFVTGMLAALGGVVEEGGDAVEALLPAEQAATLELPEELRIRFDNGDPGAADAIDGRLGSPMVERLVGRRLTAPAITALALAPELPRSLPSEMPVLLNAVRSGEVIKSRSLGRYLKLDLRITLTGDEVRNTLETVWLRLTDGAYTSPFRVSGAYPLVAATLSAAEQQAVRTAMRRWVRDRPMMGLEAALTAVRRRTRRDLERMAEFYRSLDLEMGRAAARARSDDERTRRLAKQSALQLDLDARRAQLRERMRLRVTTSLLAATLIETDVVCYQIPLRRRTRSVTITMRLRSGDSVFEGPACAACATATERCYLCDEAQHVLCDNCGQSGRLDRGRCRACAAWKADPPRLAIEDPTSALRLGNPQ